MCVQIRLNKFVACRCEYNIRSSWHRLAVHLHRDLGVGGALGELLSPGHEGEDRLPVHEEELPPVDPRRVLDHELVAVVAVGVAAHLGEAMTMYYW